MALTKITEHVIKDSFKTAISGSDSAEMTLATASIAAITSSVSTINSNMTLATASIAAITASIADNLDQAVKQASAVTFATVDTGQGANELYDMDQNVKTDSDVTFGDINSTGTITAVEVHTTFVSSSIAVVSGSNNFGDDTSDHHSFTGSLSISGSGTITGSLTVEGPSTIDELTATSLTATGNVSGSATSTGSFGILGINNPSPSANLHIKQKSGAENTQLYIDSSDHTGGISIFRSDTDRPSDGGDMFRIQSFNNNATEAGSINFQRGSADTKSDIHFRTSNAERMRIDENGKVGIGTNAPNSVWPLHIWLGNAGTDPSWETTEARNLALFETDNNEAAVSIFAPATAVNLYYAFADPSSRVAGYMKYAHSTNKLTLGAAADDKMVISGSGEVGIGTTSPLSSSRLDVNGDSVLGRVYIGKQTNDYGELGEGYYNAGTQPKYRYSDTATRLYMGGNQFHFYGAAAGTAGNNITWVHKMGLDANGRVGIGTASPGDDGLSIAYPGSAPQLQLKMASSGHVHISNNTSNKDMNFATAGTGDMYFAPGGTNNVAFLDSGFVGIGTLAPADKLHISSSADSVLRMGSSSTGWAGLRLQYKGVDKWFIQSTGESSGGGSDLKIMTGNETVRWAVSGSGPVMGMGSAPGSNPRNWEHSSGEGGIVWYAHGTDGGGGGNAFIAQSSDTSVGYAMQYMNAIDGANNERFFAFYRNDTQIGTITLNGTGNVSYDTSSDIRLKENITALTGSLARIIQIKPSSFNFISEPDRHMEGFIAHELQEVVPIAVTGERDGMYTKGEHSGSMNPQGVDYSRVTPLLTGAVQELVDEVKFLRAAITGSTDINQLKALISGSTFV